MDDQGEKGASVAFGSASFCKMPPQAVFSLHDAYALQRLLNGIYVESVVSETVFEIMRDGMQW